jgi:homoserine O-succinyltransferase
MPVCLKGNSASRNKSTPGSLQWNGRCIDIGLINNMPDSALEATERQFLALLDAASDGVLVRLSLYALPDVPRDERAQCHINSLYSGTESLWGSKLDGLIVTGREPRMPNLRDEPYWDSLTRVLEWANDNTQSTIWSCLAAHAAILHMDGIVRRKSNEKRCGVLECARVADHQLTAGLPSRLGMPHSRWNDIPEDKLTACGYSMLTCTRDAGVDTFVKRRNSLFLFFQGHPEYESQTLQLEYRRDVRRFLRGESDRYPAMPQGYFDKDTADALTTMREKAISGSREDLLEDLTNAVEAARVASTWRSTATRVYRNWLEYICAQKERRLMRVEAAANTQGQMVG